MIKITETTPQDVEQIKEWLAADPWHVDDPRNMPELMVTGQGLMSFCIQDDIGPVMYMKFTDDGDNMRVGVQFAPPEIVSKRRVALSLIKVGFPLMKGYGQGLGKKGVVFESFNPALTEFCGKNGFMNVEGSNDFRYVIEEQHDV